MTGPAILFKDGRELWFLDGVQLTKEQVLSKVVPSYKIKNSSIEDGEYCWEIRNKDGAILTQDNEWVRIYRAPSKKEALQLMSNLYSEDEFPEPPAMFLVKVKSK